jgi:cytochrome c-type biogenesis protein CcmE
VIQVTIVGLEGLWIIDPATSHRHCRCRYFRHHRLAGVHRLRLQQELLRHHRRAGRHGRQGLHSQLRVEGFVQPGSIEQNGTHVTFVLNEFESHSPKAATGGRAEGQLQGLRAAAGHLQGRCPGPGRRAPYGRDGVFHATVLQAKCASKYAPASPGSLARCPVQAAAAPNAAVRALPPRTPRAAAASIEPSSPTAN